MSVSVKNVRLLPKKAVKNELSEKIHFTCSFCEKTVGLYPEIRGICEKLSGSEFFCPFCLRHNFNTKVNKNILALTFRTIPGYFYNVFYLGHRRSMFLSEIEDYIDAHEKVGLLNPVFSYDPDSLTWFIDFNKVGRGRKKVKIHYALKTVSNILACFNLSKHIPGVRMHKLYKKYEEAIIKFYTKRYRPPGKRLLIPTLGGCVGNLQHDKNFDMEDTKVFSCCDFLIQ